MKQIRCILAVAGLASMIAFAKAATVVPEGTEVDLKFDQSLSSRSTKVGDTVRLHVSHDVIVDGVTIVTAGTHATGIVTTVDKNGRYGKNARLRIAINPIRSIGGMRLPLEPRDKGKELGGARTDEAAAATGGGAILLGPIGLVGGYFIAGKAVTVKPGDNLRTEVSHTVRFS